MTINTIKKELSKQGKMILGEFLKGGYEIKYKSKKDKKDKKNGKLNIENGISKIYEHWGLYGFRVEKDNLIGIIYVGKIQKNNSPDRLRQHLTGVNKNGSKISKNTSHKYDEIRKLIRKGFSVHVVTYSSDDFDDKSTICAVEIAVAEKAREDFKEKFPDIKHWNVRLG